MLRPVLLRLLDDVAKRGELPRLLGGFVGAVCAFVLGTGLWKLIRYAWFARVVSWVARALGGSHDAAASARREQALSGPTPVRFVVAGHTHAPRVATLVVDDSRPQLYVDTGTWRNVVQRAGFSDGFAHLEAMTFVVVYSSGEDLEGGATKTESFDYWSGFSQRWPNAAES